MSDFLCLNETFSCYRTFSRNPKFVVIVLLVAIIFTNLVICKLLGI